MLTLRSASEHQRAASLRLLGARGAARRVRGNPLRLLEVVTAHQVLAATAGARAVTDMLDEQGIDAAPVAQVRPSAPVGWASDGREMLGLLAFVARADVTPAEFDRVIVTQVADAGRMGETLGMATRPKPLEYVRMVQPGACSRCVVLAGRRYRMRDAFERHPGCNCVHIPVLEAADDYRLDPKAYFDQLSASEQDRTFTKAGAEAIRLGADPSQVVNARAGMSTAQVAKRGAGDRWTASGRLTRTRAFGQDVFTTTEGMTKHGVAYKARGGKKVRLMPESIIELADTPAERIRLLKAHGYIT